MPNNVIVHHGNIIEREGYMPIDHAGELKTTVKDVNWKLKGFKLVISKSEVNIAHYREDFLKIRAYRLDAAKVWKLSKSAGQVIKELRMGYNIVPTNKYQIVNTKYGIEIPYPLNSSGRKTALQYYKVLIKAKRKELREPEQQLTHTGFCEIQKIHFNGNGILGVWHQKLLKSPKLPKDANPHIGIEIELGFPKGVDYTPLLAFAKQVSITGDGSIHDLPANHKAEEIRILTTQTSYEKDIKGICLALNTMKAIVNKTCGLHVHLDMRGVKPEIIKSRFINLVKSQKYLQGMVTEDRRVLHYCKPTRTLDPFTMHDRYHAVNGAALNKYQTIEIRLHHGTLNADEIINWVKLLHTIIESEEIKRAPSTLESFFKKIKLRDTAKLKTYIEETIKKNTPVKDVTVPDTDTVRPPLIECDDSHNDERCLDCHHRWENHDGHNCLDEAGNLNGDRGRFPGCARVVNPTAAPMTSLAEGFVPCRYSTAGPACNSRHTNEGNCLICGLEWNAHSGHVCTRGANSGMVRIGTIGQWENCTDIVRIPSTPIGGTR